MAYRLVKNRGPDGVRYAKTGAHSIEEHPGGHMDQVSHEDTSTEVGHERRKRMRAQARGLRPAAPPRSDVFETPQWLDRSFVLPLTVPEVTDVPTQSTPHHDDYEAEVVETAEPDIDGTAPVFVRPPTPEIDFARVIRRA